MPTSAAAEEWQRAFPPDRILPWRDLGVYQSETVDMVLYTWFLSRRDTTRAVSQHLNGCPVAMGSRLTTYSRRGKVCPGQSRDPLKENARSWVPSCCVAVATTGLPIPKDRNIRCRCGLSKISLHGHRGTRPDPETNRLFSCNGASKALWQS
jgi:hypothetical protein